MSLPPSPPPAPPESGPPRKNNTLMFVGIGGGCLLLLVIVGVAFAVGSYFVMKKPNGGPSPGPTPIVAHPAPSPLKTPEALASPQPAAPAAVAPYAAQIFLNQRDGLEASLASHYVDCVFAYPDGWTMEDNVRKSGRGFVRVVRPASGSSGGTESFSLNAWTRDPKLRDADTMQRIAQRMSAAFGQAMKEYREVSAELSRAGLYQSYELKFSARTNAGAPLFGRLIFLSRQTQGQQEAPMLTLIATGEPGGVQSAEDVGVKGGLALILNTLRWGGDVAKAGEAFQKQPDGAAIIFSLLDMTEDGSLTGTELLNGELLRFDRDGDGRVTLEEYRAGNPSR